MFRKLALLIIFMMITTIQAQPTPVATVVYGQADFTSNAPNRGGAVNAGTLNYPLGMALDSSGGLYVADRNNHRIL